MKTITVKGTNRQVPVARARSVISWKFAADDRSEADAVAPQSRSLYVQAQEKKH
jgi:hypothetical protein